MARGRKPRNWIKIDCEGVLRGSINYLFSSSEETEWARSNIGDLLSLACQAVWVKMIAFSEVCGGRSGWIEDNNHNGLPPVFVARELHCPLDLFKMVIAKMKADEAVEINGTGSIRLVNFEHYQFGEYERQQPYRQGKKEAEKVISATPKKAYGEFENVLLSDEEHGKLIEKFGAEGAKDRIENLSSGLESKGYKYKNHYATILTWERMDTKKGLKGNAQKQETGTHPSLKGVREIE